MKKVYFILITTLLLVFNCFISYSQDTIRFYFSQGNYAYIGIENPFEFHSITSNNGKLLFKSDHGTITYKNGQYGFFVLNDSAVISVYKISPTDTLFIHKQIINIRKIPDPSIAIRGIELKDTLDKSFFENPDILEGFLDVDMFILKKSFQVTSFQLKIVSGKKNVSFESNNNVFTIEMKDKLKKLKSGDKLFFEDVMEHGPDGSTRYLGHSVDLEIK